LGAGINGVSLARELALNRVPVVIVEKADISAGATAYSSRLIHGGLRYLEFAEFDLVRESLAERARLLRLAPQFVRPLHLFIPVANRMGGFAASASRFLFRGGGSSKERGLWLVRTGLALYDRFARDGQLPAHSVHAVGDAGTVPVDSARYRWLCSYYDAQMAYPERFVLSMLEDCRRLAAEGGQRFELFTYHEARLDGDEVLVFATGNGETEPVLQLKPAAVINATGAWVDYTLRRLNVEEKRLIGGTKGSHFLTFHPGAREALDGRGVYAEAGDGRPVFMLPLGDAVLVGTTDIPFEGDPTEAVATEEEIEYLISAFHEVLPDVGLTRRDVDFHYCGVRPLPYVEESAPAGVTRRHWLAYHDQAPLPMASVIGGKLTTCRSLAEQAVAELLPKLGRSEQPATSESRAYPGGEEYPAKVDELQAASDRLAEHRIRSPQQAAAIWSLYGTRAAEVLTSCGQSSWHNLTGTRLPRALARYAIDHEWATSLSDLIERRLMLLYQPELCEQTLRELAQELVSAGKLREREVQSAVDQAKARLMEHYGKELRPDERLSNEKPAH